MKLLSEKTKYIYSGRKNDSFEIRNGFYYFDNPIVL